MATRCHVRSSLVSNGSFLSEGWVRTGLLQSPTLDKELALLVPSSYELCHHYLASTGSMRLTLFNFGCGRISYFVDVCLFVTQG